MNCVRDGCVGTIEDGYCTECGLKPRAEAAAAGGSDPGGRVGAGYVGSTISRAGSSTVAATTGPAPTGLTARSSRSSRTGSVRSSSRGNLGAGLVEITPVVPRDPESVVLTDPQVPEARRFCGSCGEPVGRGRDGQPGRTEGFCPKCGHPFSYTPKLQPHDLVAGQYDIVGCIAHGGLGWIYLARDRNVSDRWVVLKGLLDSGDASAMSAAIAERRFLAEVEHPDIVKIFNFVQHDGAGYIVMEYIGGRSLQELRRSGPSGGPEPLPVAQAIAFILEVLPALGYLHGRDLLFCDFKPDNVIQSEEQVKLIDLGGVHRIDDDESDLYGTIGYQAPEVPVDGPSVSSDLYTVARTLAVLIFDFHGCQDPKRYATSLPPVDDVAVFRRYPAVHRFLVRATSDDPAARFDSAAEMAEQLLGVLRQVVAIDGGQPPASPSRRFTEDLLVDPQHPTWGDLPVPRVDPFDDGATTLANLSTSRPDQLVAALEQATPTAEIRFRLARARLEVGDLDGARVALVEQDDAEGIDWRSIWWHGVWNLASGLFVAAQRDFDDLAELLPGELAPLLAGAVALEMQAGAATDAEAARPCLEAAAAAYDLVSTTDPNATGAAFGLARVRARLGDRAGAAAALQRVPTSSIHSTAAAVARCRVLAGGAEGEVTLADLESASTTLGSLSRQGLVHTELTREILRSGLGLLLGGVPADPGVAVADCPFVESDVRLGLERACRRLANQASTRAERISLIDEANEYRPRSLL